MILMSLKSDLLILGAIGLGAYVVVANVKEIGGWIGGQITEGIIEPIKKPVFEAGVQAGQLTQYYVIQPVFEAGYQTGKAVSGVHDTGVVTGQAVSLLNTELTQAFPTETAIAKTATGAALFTIPVVGPVLGSLYNWLMPR
jgi:hypothetical protein